MVDDVEWMMRWLAHADQPAWLAAVRPPCPSLTDLLLVQVIYEVVGAESRCERCEAPLDRGVEVSPMMDRLDATWALQVVTRCHGWRRHRHRATVTERSRDLLIGPFIR